MAEKVVTRTLKVEIDVPIKIETDGLGVKVSEDQPVFDNIVASVLNLKSFENVGVRIS